MTDLERKVKKLRLKYEDSLRKYDEAHNALHDAIMNCLSTDIGRLERLIYLSDRLFPAEAAVAASCAVCKIDYLDTHDDRYDVWKESFIRWTEVWLAEMKKLEI